MFQRKKRDTRTFCMFQRNKNRTPGQVRLKQDISRKTRTSVNPTPMMPMMHIFWNEISTFFTPYEALFFKIIMKTNKWFFFATISCLILRLCIIYFSILNKYLRSTIFAFTYTSSSLIFTFVPSWCTGPVCWPEKNAPGKEIWLQWRSDCWNWGLFESKDESFYKKGIEKLEKRWNKWITLEGNNVDE